MGKSIRVSCVCCKFEQIYCIGKSEDAIRRNRDILEEIKLGTHGRQIQAFVKNHPTAVLETERALYQCDICNELKEAQRMILTDAQETFEKEYTCSRCHDVLMLVTDISKIKCPVCASPTMILG